MVALTTFIVNHHPKQLGLLRCEELPGLAAAALETGLDSPSLRILAGLSAPTGSELAPFIARVADELKLDLPSSKRDIMLLAALDGANHRSAGIESVRAITTRQLYA